MPGEKTFGVKRSSLSASLLRKMNRKGIEVAVISEQTRRIVATCDNFDTGLLMVESLMRENLEGRRSHGYYVMSRDGNLTYVSPVIQEAS